MIRSRNDNIRRRNFQGGAGRDQSFSLFGSSTAPLAAYINPINQILQDRPQITSPGVITGGTVFVNAIYDPANIGVVLQYRLYVIPFYPDGPSILIGQGESAAPGESSFTVNPGQTVYPGSLYYLSVVQVGGTSIGNLTTNVLSSSVVNTV